MKSREGCYRIDGVARSASPIGRSLSRGPARRFGRADHPGAPASIKLSRHPSSARRGILEGVREKKLVRTLINSGDTDNYQRRRTANVNAGRESRTAAAGNTAATGGSVHDEKFLFRSKVLDG